MNDALLNTIMNNKMIMDSFDYLQSQLWQTAEDHGFHDAQRVKGKDWIQAVIKLALIGTEVSEAIQELRKDNKEAFEEELADIFIRLLDLAEECNVHLSALVLDKNKKNQNRPKLHDRLF